MSEKQPGISVNLGIVTTHHALVPKEDPVYIPLFLEALAGEVPTYFGLIPLRLILPFDEEFLPQLRHPDGEQGVRAMQDLIKQQEAPVPLVYPRNGSFVLSDDYHAYEAYRESHADYVPCIIMGEPTRADMKSILGPLKVGDLRGYLGITVVKRVST